VKKFILLRGRDSGSLYLYDRDTYAFMEANDNLGHGFVLEFVVDSDDRETLAQMQALVNKDIDVED
jgi:hypothetical protein